MERFWVRYNRACLERSILCQRKEAMQKDNYQLKLALRNYMGGLNPLQHNMANYSDTLMVIPTSPCSSSPYIMSPSDSDDSNSNVSNPSTSSVSPRLPSILKPRYPIPIHSKVKVRKEVTFPSYQRFRQASEWVVVKENQNLLGIPVLEGVHVIRNLQKIGFME